MKQTNEPGKIVVLRLNHRPYRDQRLTTHVCLTARALGASGVIVCGGDASSQISSVRSLGNAWGGSFSVVQKVSPLRIISEWKKDGGRVINLSMYGEDMRAPMSELYHVYYTLAQPLLVVVGSSKVDGKVYQASDFNLAVTHYPHSEVAALAIFLEKLLGNRAWGRPTPGSRIKILSALKTKGGIISRAENY